jgi:hypothetical protein
VKSKQAEIVTAKSSEMNILVPTDSGDFVSLLFILVVVFGLIMMIMGIMMMIMGIMMMMVVVVVVMMMVMMRIP